MNQTIKKAILPVAGFGTRFLPATKAQPKEMLTLVDKPVIQYIVEEAVASGISDIIFVTSQNKRAIEDHFDRNFELEYRLRQKGKTELFRQMDAINNLAHFTYVRQKSPKGDGDAILQALNLVGNEPVAVLFGDDIIDSTIPCLQQMISVFEKYHDPVIAIQRIPKKQVSRYGVVGGTFVEDRIMQIQSLIEKPLPEHAPSSFGIVGKYIITPEIFSLLTTIQSTTSDGEIRLADALISFVRRHPIYGLQFNGTRYDCGDKLGFLQATVAFGLKHPELSHDFESYLHTIPKKRLQ